MLINFILVGIGGILLIIFLYDISQTKHAILRNFPVVGHLRYILETIGPELRQYWVANDKEEMPFSRSERSWVYATSKQQNNNFGFGTSELMYETGYPILKHSAFPARDKYDSNGNLLTSAMPCAKLIGESHNRKKPYRPQSIVNISAMSFGSLGKRAITALNLGAKEANCYHNTGEGGISPYHQQGGDLVWQIGTGYFGARNKTGEFSKEVFKKAIETNPNVKMIEIKISQGAKPGFGAILPAKKNTKEIAKFRDVEQGTEIHSPAFHSAFDNDVEMLRFIRKLRKLSKGKPVGIKLCIGQQDEFERMVQTFAEKQNCPDFIAIDGAEGGSGAAHMESLHWAGMPIIEAIHFANGILKKYGLRDEIKVMAAGKIISAFDIYRMMALGADACYSARGMMFALGCVQSLKCNLDTCPTGITTMVPSRVASIVVKDKKTKVANYHKNTIEGFKELLKSMGIENRKGIDKKYIVRRINENETKTYQELYSNGLNGRKIKSNG